MAQSCLTLCNPMDCSTSGFPVRHQPVEFTQSHVHCGEGNSTPFQCSCLENPMDRGAWWAAVHGVAKSQIRLSNFPFIFSLPCIGEGKGNPLQCSCLENPRDGGAWRASIYGVAQSRTRLKQLSSSSSKTSPTPFEHNGLLFWVPDVLCRHSEVVLWNLFCVQMFF